MKLLKFESIQILTIFPLNRRPVPIFVEHVTILELSNLKQEIKPINRKF